MKKTTFGLSVAMFAAMIAAPADAAVRVGNLSRSYADAYNQVNAQRAMAQQATGQYDNVATNSADTVTNLPVRVASADLAAKLSRGEDTPSVGMENLQACAEIYPNGEFAWDRPTLGMGNGGANTCVAVVEMRGYQMAPNGGDVVLARANLASGDAVKCNISEFPSASYTNEADSSKMSFPNDTEPTIDDVIKTMNQEQKQHAGLKIAASVLVGGIGGNIAGANEPGKDGLLGGGKAKTKSTIIGALGAGGLAAASSYSGKVAGDTIMSAGVNAAGGGLVGNMMASGDSVLRIEKCKINGQDDNCLWGMVIEETDLPTDKVAFFNISDGETAYLCDVADIDGVYKNCKTADLVSIRLAAYPDKDLEEAAEQKYDLILSDATKQFHLEKTTDGAEKMTSGPGGDGGVYARISYAGMRGREIAAMVSGVRDKAFGINKTEWNKIKKTSTNLALHGRTGSGTAYELPPSTTGTKYTLGEFHPMLEDAEDGGLIDLGNKARLKTTLVGAAAGGALGAYSGYQGAQSDVENRWVSAVREYKDSLQKIYCVTGDRFLGYYNDMIVIPNMTDAAQ